MRKTDLVRGIREAQYKLGVLSQNIIAKVPGDEWVLAYTTCNGCGAGLCDPEAIDGFIAGATDLGDWYRRVSTSAHDHGEPI